MAGRTSPPSLGPQFRKGRTLKLVLLVAAIIGQMVLLSPNSLEDTQSAKRAVSPVELVTSDAAILADGIPENQIADYTVEGFRYASTQGIVKQWLLIADRAFLYNEGKLVHATQIQAQLYDAEGKITLVTGKEAKYSLTSRDVEIFGDVVVTFPDGFTTRSPYARYWAEARKIEVPSAMPVSGEGRTQSSGPSPAPARIRFRAEGLTYLMKDAVVKLPRKVHFVYTAPSTPKSTVSGQPTTIESDQCVIEQKKRSALFTMNRARPAEEQFVQINEPALYARSRRAEIRYETEDSTTPYLTAQGDVLLRDRSGDRSGDRPSNALKEHPLRYATAGRADFDHQNNQVTLREFPQVYDNNDTMTGEVITLHRDTDLIEVEHSNAYSEGDKR